MTRRSDKASLCHMLDHVTEAIAVAEGRSRTDLESDRLLNLALVRLLEIVGEAATRVTEDRRCRSPEIPWADIIGLRNRLIHGYDVVDFDILWDIVRDDLPPLATELRKALGGDP
jgi:uncharacterized protein with HEPN domain